MVKKASSAIERFATSAIAVILSRLSMMAVPILLGIVWVSLKADIDEGKAVAEEARLNAYGATTAAAAANAAVETLAATVEGAIQGFAEQRRADNFANDLRFGFLNERLDHFGNQIDSLREDMEDRASIQPF